jgi:hypothetical protein
MNPGIIISAIVRIITKLVGGNTDPREVARDILDAAIATGVAENELASYLTANAQRRAEIVADIAQAAKLARR